MPLPLPGRMRGRRRPLPGAPPGAAARVALPLDAVQRVLQRVDEDAAAVVARHLRLLDQRDRRHQGLDRRGVLPVGRVL